jgi:murein L,D-transpeptidase YcbB/YkuD
MWPYVIRHGESLATLSRRYGFDPDVVWKDEKNKSLREQRSDPLVLAAGDIVYLPEIKTHAPIPLQIGQNNVFTSPDRPPLYASLSFVDQEGTPLAGESFVIDENTDSPTQGTTKADGSIDLEVPYGRPSITIHFPGRALAVIAGVACLDPVTEPSGLDQRLVALGILSDVSAVADADAAAVVADEYRVAAIRAFQARSGLEETGEIDDDTIKALAGAHGA